MNLKFLILSTFKFKKVKSSLLDLVNRFEDNRKIAVVKRIPTVDEFLSEFLNDKNILDKSLRSAYNSAMDNINFEEASELQGSLSFSRFKIIMIYLFS